MMIALNGAARRKPGREKLMTNDQRIDEIRERCEAATPGPWDDKLTAVYKDETAIRICGEFYNFDADAFFCSSGTSRHPLPTRAAHRA